MFAHTRELLQNEQNNDDEWRSQHAVEHRRPEEHLDRVQSRLL